MVFDGEVDERSCRGGVDGMGAEDRCLIGRLVGFSPAGRFHVRFFLFHSLARAAARGETPPVVCHHLPPRCG